MLKIFNSLTQQKEVFKPIKAGEVSIYTCGSTVYDYCHIGHARSIMIFPDVIARYFQSSGYKVNYVRNITDIDDKVIKRAQENNEPWTALIEKFIVAMHEDEARLGTQKPNHEPRATQFVPQIITLINSLIEKGYAYIVEGDVYFAVRKFAEYGKLSHRDLDQLIAGTRVEINDNKSDPLDFVLWKSAKPGEPAWPSPWGQGRPGWHIECSAMSTELLGQPFDIHTGGMDLKFPHHENEIAQSEAACQQTFARIWMHIGLLMVNKEKMAKSLGNFHILRDVLNEYHPEVIRYFMLSAHYRSPINYSKDNMLNAQQALSRLYLTIRDLDLIDEAIENDFANKFKLAMDDDFNTPEAFSILFEISREINRLREQNEISHAAKLGFLLKNLAETFGLLQENPEEFLKGEISNELIEKVNGLINARNQARKNKNWQEADRIRAELQTMGVVLEDTAEGSVWRSQ